MGTSARYLFRFDDICPTMNWSVWDQIELVLLKYDIKPILAVVPDNKDQQLMVSDARIDFWDRVRQWQSWGWTIALHGYQHVYVNQKSGLLGITPNSEFAGLSREIQETKLRKGLTVFHSNGIHTETWITPSHSFDVLTLELLKSLGILIISDGFSTRAYIDRMGLVWIPCQQWERIRPQKAGLYTVVIHPNSWSGDSVERFVQDIIAFRKQITSLSHLLEVTQLLPLSTLEKFIYWIKNLWLFRVKGILRYIIRLFA